MKGKWGEQRRKECKIVEKTNWNERASNLNMIRIEQEEKKL